MRCFSRALVPVLLLLLAGCCRVDDRRPGLLFAERRATCRSSEEAETATLSVEDHVLRFVGRIATDTPSQYLVPVLTYWGDRIVLRIDAVPRPGPSPLCLGMVSYEGGITGLEGRTVRVRIEHEDRCVLDLVVTVGR